MKNAVITLFFLLLCVILGMVIYVYYPRFAEKSDEIELRQAVIKDFKSQINATEGALKIKDKQIKELQDTLEKCLKSIQ